MATLAEIREGLATNLRTIQGIQVSPYLLAAPTLPVVYVLPSEIAYHQMMGSVSTGLQNLTFVVRVFVGTGIDQAAQIKLDEFVSSGAIPTALESDKTLGGTVKTLQVTGLTAYEPVVFGVDQQAFRAEWSVQVFA